MWSLLFVSAVSALLTQGAATATAQGAAGAPAAATPEWLVVVAAPVYHPDGSVTAETTNLPAAGSGLVHVFARGSLCSPSVAGAAEPRDAGFGWRIASQVVSRSEKELVVSIDWRRVWDSGRRVSNGPGGTFQLTLHPGDRIPLDHIVNTTPRSDCRAVGLGLEVRLGRAASASPAPPVAASALPLGATAGGEKPVDAELWLMHTLPSGVEQVMHQVVRLQPAGGRFGFTPATVSTPRGDVRVELTGSIDRFRAPTGGEFFLLSMTRRVSGEMLPSDGVSGSTSTVVAMPSPADVLSFELPGTRRTAGGRGGAAATMGTGGGAGAGSPVIARTQPPAGATGTQSGDPAQAGSVRTRSAAGAVTTATRGAASNLAQVAALLDGHQFAIRLKVNQVN